MRNKPAHNSPWTDAIKAEFLKLLTQQPALSFGEIADQLSAWSGVTFTKNACIGRAGRMGHNRRPGIRKGRPRKVILTPAMQTQIVPPNKAKRHDKVLLLDLEPKDCRWPVNETTPFLFCAREQCEGSSYCAEHTDRANPPTTRQR